MDPTTINPLALPSVALSERKALPERPGIYFVRDASGAVVYIGKAVNLRARWAQHHRQEQIAALDMPCISWLTVDDQALLDEIEKACIAHFAPPMNGTGVETSGLKLITLKISEWHYQMLSEIAGEMSVSRSEAIRALIETYDRERFRAAYAAMHRSA